MDPAAYNVIYVDRRAREDRVQHREDALPSPISSGSESCDGSESTTEPEEVVQNLQALLSVFNSVSVCTSGPSCISLLPDVDRGDFAPTLILLDIPYNPQPEEELPNHDERHDSGIASGPADMLYGLPLLKFICAEIDKLHLSNSVVPVAFLTNFDDTALETDSDLWNNGNEQGCERRVLKCVDSGAMDVLKSPFTKERTRALYIQCYRARKSIQKTRKRSWVGVDEQKPAREAGDYAYLREKMVSELMMDICKPKRKPSAPHASQIRISPTRKEIIKAAIGQWDFSAHEFTDEELVYCALVMLEHGLSMPEVAKYKLSTEKITEFLFASRASYNSQIPYHNFRHVVDVLQAVFYFLLQLKALPPYITNDESVISLEYDQSLASLLTPLDAFALLVVAIGHDVGHPGVNNNFLITLKAPLAQVYNDRSVLESFHCAAFSQVLNKYWSEVLDLRKMMIEMILATDMGLHFEYMAKLDKLKRRFERDGGTRSWNGKKITEYKSLICALLIKCADISNVARSHECSAQWATILIDEFARQAKMETELSIPSSLVAPPVTGSVLALANSQVGFMRLFALPLFETLSDILPEMKFSVHKLRANEAQWASKIEACSQQPGGLVDLTTGGAKPKPTTKSEEENSEVGASREKGNSKPTLPLPTVTGTALMESEVPSLGGNSVGSSAAVSSENAYRRSTPGSPGASPLRSPARAEGDQTRVTVVVTHPRSNAGESPINGYPRPQVDDKRPTYQHSSEHLSASSNAEPSSPNRPRSSPPDLCDSSDHSCTKGCCGTTTVVAAGAVGRRPSGFFKKVKLWKRRKEHNLEAS